MAVKEQVTARQVRDYLNHLTKLKKSIKFPMSLEIEDGLYHIYDGEGNRVVTFTEQVYNVFQEL